VEETGWTAPIGLPTPDFGLTEQAPPLPDPWTAEVPGFYCIEKSATTSSDSRTYGRPGAARYTIPKSIPAGSVVVVRGPYSQTHSSPNQIKLNGTKEQPIFIRGDVDLPGIPTRGWQVYGAYYVIENLEWKLAASSESKPPCVKFLSPTDRGVLRKCKLGGNLTGGGIQVVSSSAFVAGSETKNVLVIDCEILNSGDVASTTDQDIHAINIGGKVSEVWIVDNEIHDSSGSGTQVNAGSLANQPLLHHIYLGRNHVFRTRQAGLAVKQANDVIISENKIHDVINTSWSPSKGLGFQYAPERVWHLFNEVYNCTFGIYSGSDSGMGSGRKTYQIGNVIHGIHYIATAGFRDRDEPEATRLQEEFERATGRAWNPNSAWQNAGIMLAGGLERFCVANTIYDCDSGICVPNTNAKIQIANNIVYQLSEKEGSHAFVENGATANASVLKNNLFGDVARIKWGNNTARTLSEWERLYAPEGSGCVEGDPCFKDPAAANFDLANESPAILAGMEADVYATFEATYGRSIQVDKEGKPRPFGSAWDIGAYEAQTITDPCADVKVENAKLKAENDDLRAQVAALEVRNTELVAENENLHSRIDSAVEVLTGEVVEIVNERDEETSSTPSA